MYKTLYLEKKGYVAVITLNRPDKLNALDSQLTSDFHRALDEVSSQFPEIRVLIITGAGRGFCSGADVNEHAGNLSSPRRDQISNLHRYDSVPTENILTVAPHLKRIPQPVLAAINGVAAGAGLSIALACDVRVASEKAKFSSIFIKRSLVPDNACSLMLQTIVGMGTAMEMALTGRIYDASWALQSGLVNMVVSDEHLIREVEDLAVDISLNPPQAIRATKDIMNEHAGDLYRAASLEDQANSMLKNSEDRREAVLSFVQKRRPVYKGR